MFKSTAIVALMPRDTLTREHIVAVAIDLLDADGLEGLNMRALGRRLDSAATAVYWHVGSKDNLICMAGDQVWYEITLPDLDLIDWRTAATAMATDLHAMLVRHPWLLQAFGSFLMFGAGKARHDNHLLAVFEAAGFIGAQADQAAATVFTFVLGNALGPAASASLARKMARDGGEGEKAVRDAMDEASQIAAQFPRLRARLHTRKAHYGAAPDNTFRFGLHAVLDGLGTRIGAIDQ
jgi:AcrR family transcriptional regulator